MKLQVILLKIQNKYKIPKLMKMQTNIYKSNNDNIDYIPIDKTNENTEYI